LDRPIVYGGAVVADTDTLNLARFVEVGVGHLLSAIIGTGPLFFGFPCTPGAGLAVQIGPGDIYQTGPADTSGYGSLAADTAQIVKQGILATAVSLACPAPTTAGQSITYLVQIAQEDVDSQPIVLGFYDSAAPTVPYSGQSNNGQALNTVRASVASVAVKAGVAATTGQQVAPIADAGFAPAWLVTVAFGQTTIVAGNIAAASGSVFLTETLPQKASVATVNALIATAVSPLATAAALAAEASRAETAESALTGEITAETTRAEAAEAKLAPLAAPALVQDANSNYPTTPTAPLGDATTKIANMAALAAAMTAAKPSGNISSATGPWWSWDPKTGKVECWGVLAQAISAEGAITVTFPVTMGTFQWADADVTNSSGSNVGSATAQFQSGTTTTATFFVNDSQTSGNAFGTGLSWQARGYSLTAPVVH
jgi:hypothetical protein